MTRCNTFYISDMKLVESCCPTREELDEAMTYVENTNIKYGDLVIFRKNAGYRNDGVVIFDGEKLIDLYSEIDDYGSVPPIFKVLQKNKYGVDIGLYHWHDVDGSPRDGRIDHNYIVWFDQRTYAEELENNLVYDNKLFGIYALYSFLTNYNGQKIYIVIIYQNDADSDAYTDYKTYNLKKKYLNKYKKKAIKIFKKENVPYECADCDIYGDENIINQINDKTILYAHI